MTNALKGVLVVTLGLAIAGPFVSPAYAHKQSRDGAPETVDLFKTYTLTNVDDNPVAYQITLEDYSKTPEPIKDTDWRSSFPNDLVKMAPHAVKKFTIQVKPALIGRDLHVCTSSSIRVIEGEETEITRMKSKICSKINIRG